MELNLKQTAIELAQRDKFWSADPFPLVVLDNFLPLELVNQLVVEIAANTEFQKSNDYIFARNKFENPSLQHIGPAANALRELLLSTEFAEILSDMYGRELFVDPDFVGGGLHRGGEGSFLDMHVDFGQHPRNKRWIRELNLLLYLNINWQPEYGGHLQLRHKDTGETAAIEPIFNRMVFMQTKSHTFHGYDPISFPSGTYRTSIAAYAYSQAKDDKELDNLLTTTQWAPDSGGPLKKAVAAVTPGLVALKQRLFGSSTAKKK